jgi:S-adenosylmethionine synthetase
LIITIIVQAKRTYSWPAAQKKNTVSYILNRQYWNLLAMKIENAFYNKTIEIMWELIKENWNSAKKKMFFFALTLK